MTPRSLLWLTILAATAPSVVLSQTATPDGAAVFRQRCAGCHSLTPATGVGPSLAGVVGRRAGSRPGYVYSAALKASGLIWRDATLDAYLAAPARTVPGTKMMLALPDAAQRQAVIRYLAAPRTAGATIVRP